MTRSHYLGQFRIDLTIRAGVVIPISGALLARTIRAAAEAAGAPSPTSIGLILSDDEELAALNTTHLGKHGPTDVLSFPLLPPEMFGPHPGGSSHRPAGTVTALPHGSFALPPGRRPQLGDIVVSVERATEQAREGHGGQAGDVRWSPADELLLLVTHGTLHLCGWDHAEPAEETAMRTLEARLLGRVG